ncbi:MAG: carboxypeptidase regulatory-like domain-containing protein [Anaerolineales bacterium]
MNQKLTSNQLLLIIIATALLFLTAFSFYLLQDPTAPLPFSRPPVTITATNLAPVITFTAAPSSTPIPTRQTSYTPFATLLTLNPGTSSQSPNQSETITPEGTVSPTVPTHTLNPTPSGTLLYTLTSTSASITASPAVTGTLSAGEIGVTGRVLQNGTPVVNVVVVFEDDTPARKAYTDASGHYWFTTLAPGTSFTLTFNQADNPQLSPTAEVASLAWIEGNLPTGVEIIDLPDFEISLNLNEMIFELQSPENGADYPATAINSSTPLPFVWSAYNPGGSYHIELVSDDTDELVWSSNQLTSTTFSWNGTLSDGTHISEGSYYWRVAVTKSSGIYNVIIFSPPRDLIFN